MIRCIAGSVRLDTFDRVRNPIRPKNLNPRFIPAALLAGGLLLWSHPSWGSIAWGGPLVLAGIWVRVWAVGYLVKTARLTTGGPYAYVRHPLYLGTLLIGLGMVAMLGGAAALSGAVLFSLWFGLAYLPRKEQTEADRLAALYGPCFARYRDEVPALFPRSSRWRPVETADASERHGQESWQLSRFDTNNELGTLLAVGVAVGLVCARVLLF
ncbi:MAG: isoprenylcysteine carboxylmethyltransferase family protein [Myxococcota bacterium]|nr:isoprenylcysteine carboxylmethyltransferase family protein [Myxococcota bacterium]